MGLREDHLRPAIGRTLEIFYVNDRSDGMLTAKLSNWNAQILLFPRTQLGEALARPEAQPAGVYLLFGEPDGESRLYIGESEEVGRRIRDHDLKKDWWTRAILVSAGSDLNKAHVRYLEARLVQEARTIGRLRLANETTPPRPNLSESDVARTESFLRNLLFVLPTIGVDAFDQRARDSSPRWANTAPAKPDLVQFVLAPRRQDIKATAVLDQGEFIVEAGSAACLTWTGVGAQTNGYNRLREQLLSSGVLQIEGERCLFASNYVFKSPSAAAAVVLGRSANGLVEWHTPSGLTYKDWEQSQIATSQPASAGVG